MLALFWFGGTSSLGPYRTLTPCFRFIIFAPRRFTSPSGPGCLGAAHPPRNRLANPSGVGSLPRSPRDRMMHMHYASHFIEFFFKTGATETLRTRLHWRLCLDASVPRGRYAVARRVKRPPTRRRPLSRNGEWFLVFGVFDCINAISRGGVSEIMGQDDSIPVNGKSHAGKSTKAAAVQAGVCARSR